LTADGDILVYGCDFSAGSAGLAAARILGDITGADIAGSVNDTGAADLGGDWNLETQIGSIEAKAIDAPSWRGLLAPFDIRVEADTTFSMVAGWCRHSIIVTNAATSAPRRSTSSAR